MAPARTQTARLARAQAAQSVLTRNSEMGELVVSCSKQTSTKDKGKKNANPNPAHDQ